MAVSTWKPNVRLPTLESVNFQKPPKTQGLPFLRKNQSIANLEKERPKSLISARNVFRKSIAACETRLQMLEQAFYGVGKTAEDEVMKWIGPVKHAMAITRINDLKSLMIWRDIVMLSTEVESERKADATTMALLKDSIDKSFAHVPGSFEILKQEIIDIQRMCSKYLCSFRPGKDTDKLLDTITHYDLKMNEFIAAISNNMGKLDNLSFKFRYSGIITAHDYSLEIQELARRCDAVFTPHLLMFPEACARIRNCLKALSRWVDEDEQYVTYLQIDVEESERKVKDQEKVVRESQEAAFQGEFRLKKLKKDISDSAEELRKLKIKEVDWQSRQLKAESTEKYINIDLEVKTSRLDGMKSEEFYDDEGNEIRLGTTAAQAFDFSVRQLSKEIQELQVNLPRAELELMTMNKRLAWLQKKRERQRTIEVLCSHLEKELKGIKKEREADQFELERRTHCLQQLRHTLMLKCSNDVVKKIFHKMPIPLRPPGAQPYHQKPDDLDKACKMIKSEIELDWGKLYRNLPFNPPRGEANILADVADITNECMRNGVEEHCIAALQRWRRHHTRASVPDLLDTLKRIKHPDLANKIESRLKKLNDRKPKAAKAHSSLYERRRAAWMAQYERNNPLLKKSRQKEKYTHSQLKYSMGRVVLDEIKNVLPAIDTGKKYSRSLPNVKFLNH